MADTKRIENGARAWAGIFVAGWPCPTLDATAPHDRFAIPFGKQQRRVRRRRKAMPLRDSQTAEIAGIRDEWQPAGAYLNTATYGLPPTSAHNALLKALDDWRTGRTSEEFWEECTERARAAFGRLVGVKPGNVTVGATVSELIGLLAASLPDESVVLLADGDFASTIFPWTVHQDRGVVIKSVPLASLSEAVDAGITMVAFSHVQPASGDVADLDGILAAARHYGALVCVDGTQACGWLPTDAAAIDFYVCHAYKWLMSPRGTAFMSVSPGRLDRVRPLHAGWYATADPNNNLFGMPLRLAPAAARRLDTSPAWFFMGGNRRCAGARRAHRGFGDIQARLGLGRPVSSSLMFAVRQVADRFRRCPRCRTSSGACRSTSVGARWSCARVVSRLQYGA